MQLFQLGHFVLSSGKKSHIKVDCDALTDGDWEALAWMAVELLPYTFKEVISVPRGGDKFATHLRKYVDLDSSRILICDDVLTTGASMEKVRGERLAMGVVVFARGPLPYWVKAVCPINIGNTA